MTVKADDFRKELTQIFSFANAKRLHAVEITAGDLHRLVGDYPGYDHRMPTCCNVMRSMMVLGDEVVTAPPKRNGASLKIRYFFPRK